MVGWCSMGTFNDPWITKVSWCVGYVSEESCWIRATPRPVPSKWTAFHTPWRRLLEGLPCCPWPCPIAWREPWRSVARWGMIFPIQTTTEKDGGSPQSLISLNIISGISMRDPKFAHWIFIFHWFPMVGPSIWRRNCPGTPQVTSLSPNRGTARGDTLVTLYGEGLEPLDSQGVATGGDSRLWKWRILPNSQFHR